MINPFARIAQPFGIAALVLAAGVASPAHAALEISQTPLYLASADAAPPLNMLVMGRDHKLYYEAYNDASDLNGDGILDVGYKPADIDYFGYFDSYRCYSYSSGTLQFTPGSATANKKCSNAWSGDFLNYLTTARMDAMRKVLYGGYRVIDTASNTVLERTYVPQDAHSWGKEYTSAAYDGYNISEYAPLSAPATGKRHLFANTTLRGSEDRGPLLRVLTDSGYRIWNWVSKENPVAGDACTGGSCASAGTAAAHPGHPQSLAAFDTMQATYAVAANQYGGTFTRDRIDCNAATCNQGNASQDNYLTIVTGTIDIKIAGHYRFRVNGDDNIDFQLFNSTGTLVQWAGCYPGGGRGFDGDCTSNGSKNIAVANSLAVGHYTFKFRMEEMAGGDGYRLEWERRSATSTTTTAGGNTTNTGMFPFRVMRVNGQDAGTGDPADARAAGGFLSNPTFHYYNLRPVTGVSAMTDYRVRVQVCVAGALEANCKEYPSGSHKPTGILHDYGENDQMYFGLLTGSYAKNTAGGVLRRNISSFADEIDADDGTFNDTIGIVKSIDRQRTIDFSAYQYSCGWIANRAISDGECSMWGNPVAEMMYESLRYFGGADAPRSEFNIASDAKDAQAPLNLPRPDWVSPYDSVEDDGAGYLRCAAPVMTVISDINPSYDADVPGSSWSSVSATDDPEPIDTLDVGDEVDDVWAAEGGGSREVFIGESGGTADAAPTVKTVSNLSTVRGLAPEEPSKQGTYYSAGVARFGANNPIGGDKEVLTYAIALASPLPTLKFPVGDDIITVVPFAKSPYGRYGGDVNPGDSFQPTNQIVDFYVQTIANTDPGGSDEDDSVNGGRPYAEFRINYEDVEQGADHDMDAIALYVFSVTADGDLTISLRSEYASGSIVQYLGYIISGTTKDGIYLEVSDCDTSSRYASTSFCTGGGNGTGGHAYKLNTPPGRDAGYCEVAANLASNTCKSLPYETSRTFEVGDGEGAGLLRDPLWYAAKYGRSSDISWDGDGDNEPDNYFLVTNAGTLKEQLDRAFSQIISDTRSSGGVAASGTRREAGFLAYVPEYNSADWTGDLRAHGIIRNEGGGDDGNLIVPAYWSAKTKLATRAASDRDIFFVKRDGTSTTLEPFESGGDGLGATDAEIAGQLGVAENFPVAFGASMTFDDVIEYLRGDPANEVRNGGRFRNRSSKIGDILGSQPTVLTSASYGYSALGGGGDDTAGESYRTFLTGVKKTRKPVVFVGANDGMLHAFDATTETTGGDELFAVIPNSVLSSLSTLAHPSYTHRYFVDGSPVQGDAFVDGEWKTVLLAATGAGGRSVMALDVTDPATAFNDDNFLWEFSDRELGYTIGQPAIALLQDGRWVALVGNGYNSSSHRAYLFVLDLATGEELARIQLGDSGSEENPNGVVSVLAIDTGPESTGADSMADIIYAADYQGNVWRIGVEDALGEPTLLFAAGRTITGGLGAAFHHVSGQMVFFGTGRYLLEGDNAIRDDAESESFYGVWDDNTGTTVTADLLQPQSFVDGGGTTTEVIDWSEQKGWSIVLPENGERFIGVPDVTTGRVIFTSYVPVGDECTPGGTNFLNILNTNSGTGGLPAVPPSEGDPTPPPRGREELPPGGGGPVQSPPVVSTPPEGECDPTDPECIPEEECEEDDPFDCDVPPRPEAKECKTDLGILLSDGIENFDSLTCGRQSWREIR